MADSQTTARQWRDTTIMRLSSPIRYPRSAIRFLLASLLASRSHNTALPTAAHTSQSRALNGAVENAS